MIKKVKIKKWMTKLVWINKKIKNWEIMTKNVWMNK